MNSQEQSMRRVTAIRNGTVIDHIPAGKALSVLKMLGIDGSMSNPVSLVMNVPSKKMGGKDIIKVEDRELDENEIEKLALLSPSARINIIRNYAVADKKIVDIPEFISDIVKCPNENCICNNERGATSNFSLVDDESIKIQCTYCGRKIDEENINFL